MGSSLESLQNGSDIRGIALDGVPGEQVNFTTKIAELIGKSFCFWLKKTGDISKERPVIGAGMDSRISGPQIKAAFIKGLKSQGAKVLDFDLATTPAMFMSTQFEHLNCDGAVMVTASHLPPNRNGLKFFTKNGGLEKHNITEILALASEGKFESEQAGTAELSDIITPYSEFLTDYVKTKTGLAYPLKDLKIVVDAGNGAGGFFAKQILEPLGAITDGSQFLEPDGRFPNHVPNPEDKEAIESIRMAVLKNKADLGVIFDTDVDRAAVVDKNGKPINRNSLIALLSSIVLDEHPNSYIVTDSVTSSGLAEFISKKGGIHHRFKRGYKNVINESIRLNNSGKESWLAIETSGHGAFRENFFLDDGAFIIAKVLVEVAKMAKLSKTITEHIIELKQAREASEFRITINDPNFLTYGEMVIEDLKKFVNNQSGWIPEGDNYEGFRVNCTGDEEDGWFLLRLSLHDPVLPLNIESNIKDGMNLIIKKLIPFFKQYAKLNLKCLFEA